MLLFLHCIVGKTHIPIEFFLWGKRLPLCPSDSSLCLISKNNTSTYMMPSFVPRNADHTRKETYTQRISKLKNFGSRRYLCLKWLVLRLAKVMYRMPCNWPRYCEKGVTTFEWPIASSVTTVQSLTTIQRDQISLVYKTTSIETRDRTAFDSKWVTESAAPSG